MQKRDSDITFFNNKKILELAEFRKLGLTKCRKAGTLLRNNSLENCQIENPLHVLLRHLYVRRLTHVAILCVAYSPRLVGGPLYFPFAMPTCSGKIIRSENCAP